MSNISDHMFDFSPSKDVELPPSFIPQIKRIIMETVRDLKCDFRTEYTVSTKELKTEFQNDMDVFRRELNILKQNFDSSLRNIEVEFLRDIQEAKERKNNLMVFGIKESDEVSFEKRKESDLQMIEKLASDINVIFSRPHNIIRLGKVGNTPRPIKLIGLSKQTRDDLLRSSSKIRKLDDSLGLNSVFIKPDLTPKQQLSDYLLRKERRGRRERGENSSLRDGKIVQYDSSARAQNTD